MELYFLRHAIAADSAASRADSERPLTEEGIQKMKKIAGGMRRLGIEVDGILSSPYVRAHETAELAAEGIRHCGKIRFTEALVPGSNFKALSGALKEYGEKDRLLLVGHQPSLGHFVSQLVAGCDGSIDFKKGGLCLVEAFRHGNALQGELKWLLTPLQLRTLA